jgi:hypothetical protein
MQLRWGKVPKARELSRFGYALSRPAQRRLQWMVHYLQNGRNATSTCRRHEVDPQLYFTQLLLNLPPVLRALPHTRCHELDAWLPDQWKLRQAARLAAV